MKNISLTLFSVCFFFISCSGTTEYPPEIKENFVRSCAKNDEAKKVLCTCVFDKIKEKYTYKEYVDLEEKMKAGQTPQDFLDFTDQATGDCQK